MDAAPAGVPRPVLDRLSAVALGRPRRPETRAALGAAGFVPIAGDAEAFARHKAADTASWGGVIHGRGVRLS